MCRMFRGSWHRSLHTAPSARGGDGGRHPVSPTFAWRSQPRTTCSPADHLKRVAHYRYRLIRVDGDVEPCADPQVRRLARTDQIEIL